MANGSFQKRIADWFKDRRGPEELANFCVVVALVLVVINIFASQLWITIVALALVAYAVWRMCSKNVVGRAKENVTFLRMLGPVRPWVQDPSAAMSETRTYKHVKCPNCGQKIRLPRGKGNLRVTCPTCHEKFESKS